MNALLQLNKPILKPLLVLILVYSITRCIFVLYNLDQFQEASSFDIIKAILFGVIPDVSAIVYLNGVVFILLIVDLFIKIDVRLIKSLFLVLNSIGLLVCLIDIPFYEFRNSRLTIDFFKGDNNILSGIRDYVFDYSYLLFIWIGLLWIINRFIIARAEKVNVSFLFKSLNSIIVIGILFLLARGSLGPKPLTPYNGFHFVSTSVIDIWNNSCQTVLYSLTHKGYEAKAFFSNSEIEQYYSPIVRIEKVKTLYKNVILVLLESFGKEHIGHKVDGESVTPFLDSLIEEGLYFENCFANGRTSKDGLIALLSGVPKLARESYITSIYNSNTLENIGDLLEKKNIDFNFFHGATNGAMNFDLFCQSIGVKNYYGRSEFDDDSNFDGIWGIYDKPFLNYCAKELLNKSERNFSIVFTLSSHHPYSLPEEEKQKYKVNGHPLLSTIKYTDDALRSFVKTINLDSTLLIISADHGSINVDPVFNNALGRYRIPLLFYGNGIEPKKDSVIIQQTDILPKALSYLGLNDTLVWFNGLNDSIAFRLHRNNYYLTNSQYTLVWNENSQKRLYNSVEDPFLRRNIADENDSIYNLLEDKLKAVIQQYNNRMIKDDLVY